MSNKKREIFFLKLQFKEKLAIEVIAGKQQDANLCRKKYKQTCFIGWSKFTWINRERNITFPHYRKPWTQWMTIFSVFHDFKWKNSEMLLWFHVKWLKLQESGVNGISHSRTEVKQDFLELLNIAVKSVFTNPFSKF